jgi:DNA-binding MarR family transcriptional regulator
VSIVIPPVKNNTALIMYDFHFQLLPSILSVPDSPVIFLIKSVFIIDKSGIKVYDSYITYIVIYANRTFTEGGYQLEENILIHKLLEIFEYKSEYQFQISKIQPRDMFVLERIFINKKTTIKEISNQYNIAPSTLTGIIDRLERKKLIKRLRTHIDRRTIELLATKEGNAAVEKHIQEDMLFSRNFFHSLEADKKEKFQELLEELLGNVNKEALFITAEK